MSIFGLIHNLLMLYISFFQILYYLIEVLIFNKRIGPIFTREILSRSFNFLFEYIALQTLAPYIIPFLKK